MICMALMRESRTAMQLHHLVSGVEGSDSRTRDAVRRTGLLLPTLLPVASACAGGRVSFSLRRSRARSALQLQGAECRPCYILNQQHVRSLAASAVMACLDAGRACAHTYSSTMGNVSTPTCGSRTAGRPHCAGPSGRQKLPL